MSDQDAVGKAFEEWKNSVVIPLTPYELIMCGQAFAAGADFGMNETVKLIKEV